MSEARKRVQHVLDQLNAFLPGKVDAYGAAHEVQPRLWRILLEPYQQADGTYRIPAHVVREIPRLTRCFDRVLRIVNAPTEGDLHGEHPWVDLAGDAIAGEATRLAYAQAARRLLLGSADDGPTAPLGDTPEATGVQGVAQDRPRDG